MAGLVPAIHVCSFGILVVSQFAIFVMPGLGPGMMTVRCQCSGTKILSASAFPRGCAASQPCLERMMHALT